jgi:hypothetical protein
MDIPCSYLNEYKSYRIDIWINKELSFYSSSPYFRPFFYYLFLSFFPIFPAPLPATASLGMSKKIRPK